MRKALTDAFCKATPPPNTGRAEWADLKCVGLEFRVTAGGSRSWTFRFRDPVSRRTLRAGIGAYPDIGLSAARLKADELRRQVANSINPIEQKRQERREASGRDFQSLADRYMAEHARRHKRPRSAAEDDRNLKKHVLPIWKDRDFRKIKRADVIELVEGLVKTGKHTAANRVHALISKIFSFAMDSDLHDANPAARLRKRGTETPGKRVLSDDEIQVFWHKIVQSPVTPLVGNALRLILLTGARANEMAGAARGELRSPNAPKEATWVLPAERVKNKRDHLIPLSPLSLKLLQSVLKLGGENTSYLFPSPTKHHRPITSHSLAVAMSRFCDSLIDDHPVSRSLRRDPPSPHDLRRTFATKLSALGVPREDRDACMNHARNDVGATYDLYEREREKRAAVQALSKDIERIVFREAIGRKQ
jgi:integrase